MAMLDRAWLPNLAVEHKLDWKFGNGSAINQRRTAPAGFPQSIGAEMAWTGAKFQGHPDLYRIELNDGHIKELEEAATEVEGNPVDLRAASSMNSD
jgi:hypothetical protein